MKIFTPFHEHLINRCYVSKKQLLIFMTFCLSVIGHSQTFTDTFITYQVSSTTANTVRVVGYNTAGGAAVTIPATVTYNSISYTVTSINDYSFENSNLNSVTLPNSIVSIGNGAFFINNIVNITIPNSVTSIGESAFSVNPLNSVVSEAITPPAIFTSNNNLDSFAANRSGIDLIIPTGTTNDYLTNGWTGFNSVTESGSAQVGDTFVDSFITYEITSLSPDEVEAIDYNTAGGTVVTIPNTVQNNTNTYSVTSIGMEAFRLKQLTEVTISGNVTTIGSGAFSDNNNMITATIQNGVVDIQNSAFFNSGLTSITIPDSVVSIGNQAFDFTDIGSINFGNGLNTIGFGAFRNTLLTSITIPSSVTSIGSVAFANSPLISVTSLATIPPDIVSVPTVDTFGSNRSNIDLFIPFGTLNDYVTNPSPTANWTGFNSVTEATLSVGDTFVVDFITYRITSLSPDIVEVLDYDVAGGTSVNIPSTVSDSVVTYDVNEIEGNAFNAKGLTSVTISDSVINIGNQAFLDNALTSLTIGNNVETIGSSAFDSNSLTSVVIPNSVTTLGARAFDDNLITDVIIGSSVTNIEFGAFRDNPLATVVSLAVTPPSIITDSAFPAVVDSFSHDRSNINLVVINNATDEYVTDPGALWTGFKMVFEATSPTTVDISNYDPANGTNVVIPASVTAGSNVFDVVRIDDSAFENIGLTSVTIPSSVTEIGISAFELNNLTSVTIPDSVTLIGTTAFATNSITSLSLGANVSDIGIGAFVDNDLSDITIPSNVTFIGLLAFGNNPLASVTSLAIVPPIITTGTNDTFAFDRSNIALQIPAGTMGAYVTDPGALWTGFNPVTEGVLSIDEFDIDNQVKVITTSEAIKILSDNSLTLRGYVIYNINGAEIASGKAYEINTNSYANGIYMLKLSFDRGTTVKKVLIE